MKTLCVVLVLFGQFEIQELPVSQTAISFVEEEIPVIKTVDNRPTFDLLTAEWCGGCQSTKQSLSKLDKDKLPFKYQEWNVDTKGWLNANSIPAFAYQGRVFQYGYSDPETLLKNYQAAVTRSKPTQSFQRLTATQLKAFAHNYRGPTVGIKGMTAYQHLQDSNHGFTANQLQGISESECFKIHGAHHYTYLTPFNIWK